MDRVILEMLQRIEGRLEKIEGRLSSVEEVVERIQSPPSALPPKEVSRMLGCSISKTKGLIRDRQLRTVLIGKRRHIPISEVARLTNSVAVAPTTPLRGPLPPRPRTRKGKSQADAIRDLAKRKD